MSRIGPLMSNYWGMATLAQFLQHNVLTLLFLLKINPRGFHALVYNSLPLWAQTYILFYSNYLFLDHCFSFGDILSLVTILKVFATLTFLLIWLLKKLVVFCLFKRANSHPATNKVPSTGTIIKTPPALHSQAIILNSLTGSAPALASNIIFNTLAYAQAHFVTYYHDFKLDPQKVVYLAN